MYLISFLAALLMATQVWAQVPVQVQGRTLKVAVVDTGLNTITGAPVCDNGHIDFSGGDSTMDTDPESHGSNVAALIAQEAGPTGYCLIIVKIFGPRGTPAGASAKALQYLAALKPDIVNLSWGGSREYPDETEAILDLIKAGTKVVAAAGNRGTNFDAAPGCNFYPACIPGVTIVGNDSASSNFGRRVDIVLDGNHRQGGGSELSGSSQSAALYTGRLVKALLTAPSLSSRRQGDR